MNATTAAAEAAEPQQKPRKEQKQQTSIKPKQNIGGTDSIQ